MVVGLSNCAMGTLLTSQQVSLKSQPPHLMLTTTIQDHLMTESQGLTQIRIPASGEPAAAAAAAASCAGHGLGTFHAVPRSSCSSNCPTVVLPRAASTRVPSQGTR